MPGMENWYLLSLAALLLLGTQRFLYKVAAEKNCNSAVTTAVFMATVAVLSGIAFYLSGEEAVSPARMLGLALLNSSAFALSSMANIEALKNLPAAVCFPLSRLSLLVVVLVSVGYWGEQLTAWQWLGVLLGGLVIVVLSRDLQSAPPRQGTLRKGLLLVVVCIGAGAVASISSKLAAESISKTGFMALSYLFGTVFSLGIVKRWGRCGGPTELKAAVIIGLGMGVLNFFGFYTFLLALASGPLSVIALLTGMHFVIAILLSMLFFGERLTLKRGIGIGLTLLTVFFLKQ